jgi:glycosyltransferase involved in cell wall biosynthesis
MKLFWATDYKRTGVAFGFSVHRNKLKEALLECGVQLTSDPSEPADLAVHVSSSDYFNPVPGMKNLFFTQAEGTSPTFWDKNTNKADLLVTSCKQSKEALATCYPGQIEICPLGIDPIRFPYYRRTLSDPFRVLFVGNTEDTHKGYDILWQAVKMWEASGKMPGGVQLCFKASGVPGGTLQQIQRGTFWDTRNLSTAELRELYNWAHVFVFPSCSEGWGLTLTEAMATGIPCIWTHWSAMVDYADETIGYPIKEFQFIKIGRTDDDGRPLNNLVSQGALVDPVSIILRLEAIYHDYETALALGLAASERMHSRYTWRQAAEHFIEICEKVMRLRKL